MQKKKTQCGQLCFFCVTILCMSGVAFGLQFAGVNLSGADFGENDLPGTYGANYIYPNHGEVDYFVGKGMNIFRLPFRWERLQRNLTPSNFPSFNSTELGRIEDIVDYATGKGAYVLLDPHNYARYYDEVIGGGYLPVEAFADFWTKLANNFKNNDKVIFGLMNEPNGMSAALWRDDANAAIAAIRATGAENFILVPGDQYSSAASWLYGDDDISNAEALGGGNIVDPLNFWAFEAHQYLDAGMGGVYDECVSETYGATVMRNFTSWCRANGFRAFLGEFSTPYNTVCNESVEGILSFMDDNDDVWMGWTWWAAGPWWGDDDIWTIEPKSDGSDRPQMSILEPHLGNYSPPPTVKISASRARSSMGTTLNIVNSNTSVTFSIMEQQRISLSVYNTLGKEVKTIAEGQFNMGQHKVELDVSDLPGSIYYCRLQSDNFTTSKKFTVVR